MIVGNNGSGKSHLARELSAITGLPAIHLDAEYWRPGWGEPTREEWIARQEALVAREKWIIDGMHASTMEVRFAAADAVIFLDIGRPACLFGVLRRYGKKRPDMPHYLDERMDRAFWRFLVGLWRFPTARRPAILALHEKYPDIPLLIVRSRRGARRLLREWPGGTP